MRKVCHKSVDLKSHKCEKGNKSAGGMEMTSWQLVFRHVEHVTQL